MTVAKTVSAPITSRTRALLRVLFAAFLTAGLLAAGTQIAHAAPAEVTVDGVTFREIVEGDPSAGAAVYDYEPSENPDHPALVLPGTVEINGADYAVKVIEEDSLFERGLTSIVIPETVEVIEEWSLDGNEFTSLVIPNSVTFIGASAFYGNNLTSLTLGSSLTEIDAQAFAGNDLTSVIIPASVTTIGPEAFYDNPLTAVIFDGAAPSITPADPDEEGSFGDPADVTLHYKWEFDESVTGAGGFTTPTWQGYTTERGPESLPVPVDITMSASSTTVDEGDSITLTVHTVDSSDNEIQDVTDQAVFTSDVPTDIISGNTVTFPTASVHTITATLGDFSQSIEINVIAASNGGDDGGDNGADGDSSDDTAADDDSASDDATALTATGGDTNPPVMWGALALILLGATALLVRRRLS